MAAVTDKTNTPSLIRNPINEKEPSGSRITLSLCNCYQDQRIVMVTVPAERVASILGITILDLECLAVTAMLTQKPQVAACYKQRDLAAQKLQQLEDLGSFVIRGCVTYQLLHDD
jgi:hypothetical protein